LEIFGPVFGIKEIAHGCLSFSVVYLGEKGNLPQVKS
jgi:hypothetical protein